MARCEEAEEWHACAQLVDEEEIGSEVGELGREDSDREDEVELAEGSAEDGEPGEDGGRHEGVATDADIEGALEERKLVLASWCLKGVFSGEL